jgi:hypothetical protein
MHICVYEPMILIRVRLFIQIQRHPAWIYDQLRGRFDGLTSRRSGGGCSSAV